MLLTEFRVTARGLSSETNHFPCEEFMDKFEAVLLTEFRVTARGLSSETNHFPCEEFMDKFEAPHEVSI